MGTQNILWNSTKKLFTFGLIGLTISDRYASVSAVRGASMSPTFNPSTSSFMGTETCEFVSVISNNLFHL